MERPGPGGKRLEASEKGRFKKKEPKKRDEIYELLCTILNGLIDDKLQKEALIEKFEELRTF